MARARNIKPGFYKNEDLAECSIWARYIFPGLWMLADREGRMEDRPKRIKGELLPFDSQDVEPLLRELEGRGFIIRYQIDGASYIQISKFLQHQAPHYSEKPSTIKPPILPESSIDDEKRKPENSRELPEKPTIKRGSQPPDSLIPDSLIPDSETNPQPLLSGKPDDPLKPEKKKLSAACIEVLEFLNEKTGRNYRPVKANINLIAARLKDGATVTECRQVIAKKCREWRDDPNQEIYLRPKTLFNATNFANYQGELVA